MVEMKAKLGMTVPDEKKRDEIIRYTRLRLKDILDSFDENVLLPKRQIASEQDFETHIMQIIRSARKKLLNEVEKETS
jgi:DNA-directed RNA polymerase beta' subunit